MLYRFRSIDKLIGVEYEELQKQYFYFSPPYELNDPLEGFVDFFWKADDIAWLGLFKNYVWQLFNTLIHVRINAPLENIKKMFFSRTEIYPKDSPFFKFRFEVEKNFTNEKLISEIASILGKSNKEINSYTLKTILGMIHSIALFHANELCEQMEEKVFTRKEWLNDSAVSKKTINYQPIIEIVTSLLGDTINAEKIFAFTQSIRYKLELETTESNLDEIMEYLIIDFPDNYVKHVTNLAYSDWHTVCFNRNYKDTKMWSHYASNHEGVCLMFNFKSEDHVALTALDENSKDKNKNLPLKPIDYDSKPSRINFFLTLGNLWGDERQHWFFQNDETSTTLTFMLNNEEKWRKDYWIEFEKRFLRKGHSWNSEQEVRLIINDHFYSHQSANSRKYKYDFNKLDGIIFGINTKLSDKKKIIKIVKEKCKENMRDNFCIYQARYDTINENIEKDLVLKINSNKIISNGYSQ